jgi:outer membrane cobalamin receptor
MQTRNDTLKVAVKSTHFIAGTGSVLGRAEKISDVRDTTFRWRDDVNPTDVLTHTSGFFYRSLGEWGQPMHLMYNGVNDYGLPTLLDGRTVTDPYFGRRDLNTLPLEDIKRFEMLSTSEAMFVTGQSVAGALNVVTPVYSTSQPYSKLRYVQGPNERLLSDGVFSQNMRRDLNVALGFQRHVNDGRFSGSAYDSWIVRSRIRFNPSHRLNLWMSDLYYRGTTQFNGGIDLNRSPSIFDNITALLRTDDAFQTVARRDFTLGGAARFFPDTLWLTRLWLYTSWLDREYIERNRAGDSTRIVDNLVTTSLGAQVEQQLVAGPFTLKGRAVFERRKIEKAPHIRPRTEHYTSFSTSVSVIPFSFLDLSASAQAEHLRGNQTTSYGMKATVKLIEGLGLFAEYARAYRHPTMQEYHWVIPPEATARYHSSARPHAERHKNWHIGIDVSIAHAIYLSAVAFIRTLYDAIIFHPLAATSLFPAAALENISHTSLEGVQTDVRISYWKLSLAAAATLINFQQEGMRRDPFPRLVTSTEVTYRDTLFDGALEGVIGTRLVSMSKQDGMQYNPRFDFFLRQTDVQLGAWSRLDLYTVLRLGSAYLTLSWRNALGIDYLITPTYPMPGSEVTLGVNWMFLD